MGMFDLLAGNIDPDKIYEDVSEGAELTNTDFQQNTGEQMFDPNSAYNQRQLSGMRQGTMDQMAMGGLMGQRMGAMGQNFGSNQRMQANNAQSGEQLHQGFNQHLQQAANTGTGLLGQAMQGKMANTQIQQGWRDAKANQRAQNASNTSGMFQGLLGAGLGGAMSGAFGGLFNTGGQAGNQFGQDVMNNLSGMNNQQPGYDIDWSGGLMNLMRRS